MRDDTILFSMAYARVGLQRVAANGGSPETVTTPDVSAGEYYHSAPKLLPGGDAVLFQIATEDGYYSAVLDLATKAYERLPTVSGRAVYTAGHIVYGDSSRLLAVRFDADRREVIGAPFPVYEGVSSATDGPLFTVSRAGTLIYIPGTADPREVVWSDRSGASMALANVPEGSYAPRVSPSGNRLVVAQEGVAIFQKEPTAKRIRSFLNRAADAAGRKPSYLISDHDPVFDCDVVNAWCGTTTDHR